MDAILEKRVLQGEVDEDKAAEEKSIIASRKVDSTTIRTLAKKLLSGTQLSQAAAL